MGTKNNPGKYDCYHNAEPDEPMFILLARDEGAPFAVRFWTIARYQAIRLSRKPKADLKMIEEAEECAKAMEAWRKAHRPKPKGKGERA